MVFVHVIVCRTFHGPPPSDLHEVAHNDGDRENPSADNLRWATRSENHADKKLHGTSQHGTANGSSVLTDEDVITIRAEYIPRKNSMDKLAKKFGVNKRTIHKIINNKLWRHI